MAKLSAMERRDRRSVFNIVNTIIFILICFLIIVPIYKVLVDSFDTGTTYAMALFPRRPGLEGYITVFTNPTLYRPFLISCVTTICGTLMGLLLSTLAGYVLIQWKMPGRTFLGNFLLFTMVFEGGMIPLFLVVNALHLTNNLLSVILLPAISVYNLVLMRNFFEGIPDSLFEAAEIDGCSPMQIFWRVMLPLSKAALASIGLMFAVSYWNNYTNFKLYITDSNLYNFQMKLRSMIMGSDLPTSTDVGENTIKNAAVIVAIIPFMIIYPFCQKYFIQGINMGAVKE